MAEIIKQRVEKTTFGDVGKDVGNKLFFFLEVLAGDGEKRHAVGGGGDGAEGACGGVGFDGEKHRNVIPKDADGEFVQMFLWCIRKFMELIDFQCSFGFAQITRRELFRMERCTAGRKQQNDRQKQADGFMSQEGKELHDGWNDKEGGGGGQQNAERQDEACAEHDRMFGSEQGPRRKNRGKSR